MSFANATRYSAVRTSNGFDVGASTPPAFSSVTITRAPRGNATVQAIVVPPLN